MEESRLEQFMVYHGQIKNGEIVLDQKLELPEGTRVVISPETPAPWSQVLKDVVGKAEGLPADLARNHDHYLHGAPKK